MGSQTWGAELPQGDVTLLERALTPGETCEVLAGLWTPAHPGRYTLTWDMLCEGVSWFSARGSAPLCHEVEVVDDGARPLAPHFPGVPPVDQDGGPAPTAASRVVAVPPVRVLDTRDGSGLIDAPRGPIGSDDIVVLRLAGAAGVAPDAVGVICSVSVLQASYDGFVTVYPTDGTSGEAFPHVHFSADGRPVTNTTVSALGRGRGHGRLSLHLAPGPPGTSAQLIVDVSGYLVAD